MELANSETITVRQATLEDRGAIFRLLQISPFSHMHSDWRLPADWLGDPGFVLAERERGGGDDRRLMALLAAAADPLPAAWIRLAALLHRDDGPKLLAALMAEILPHLGSLGVTQLGWFPATFWPDRWLRELGFEEFNRIITFEKKGLDMAVLPDKGVRIRPAMVADMFNLAGLDAEAFEPLWRHSEEGLRLAFNQAQSFDVAELEGKIAGFQYSVRGQREDSAHLVRITVSPEVQGRGVGSALMASALTDFRKVGVRYVSLNTQIDNLSSHRLYRRFGFKQAGTEIPVWAIEL